MAGSKIPICSLKIIVNTSKVSTHVSHWSKHFVSINNLNLLKPYEVGYNYHPPFSRIRNKSTDGESKLNFLWPHS